MHREKIIGRNQNNIQLSLFDDIDDDTLSFTDVDLTYNYNADTACVKNHEVYINRIAKGIDYYRWRELTYVGQLDVPVIQPYEATIPTTLVSFSNLTWQTDSSCSVHFYEHDYKFNRFIKNPEAYLPILLRMHSVITPDCSQYVEMPAYKRLYNSCLNKELGAFMQSHGVRIIVNVSWSTPDSYDYAFEGIPQDSVIAINSLGAKKNNVSRYLWFKGYEQVQERLRPRSIIRYGEKMPNENESISTYFANEKIRRKRNGR